MKPLPNKIVLRPRFKEGSSRPKEEIISALLAKDDKKYLIKRLDDHIYFKFHPESTTFWSPQLHLEVVAEENGGSTIYGLFGPNPTLWTFFMFLHFGVATFFVIFGIWGYSSASLGRPYGIHLGVMIFLVVLWFVLYFFGRSGKKKGTPQMQELYDHIQAKLKNQG